MRDLKIRASCVGKIMAEPRTKSEGILSVGAKTYLREIAKQEIFGVEFEVSSKEMEKGNEVEPESIEMLNRVRGLSLVKNTERKTNKFLTGECDLFDKAARKGYDMKNAWSAKTFPGWLIDCGDKVYEWQMRAYMQLWDADEWEVVHALVDTPQRLIGFEPIQMHIVSHIPEHMRITGWIVERDFAKERLMIERVEAAREYVMEVIQEFDENHREAVA
tara:strand:+ start:408 stop:1061 length:654 start_codon:yes stop_codon:yes gene_type:complete